MIKKHYRSLENGLYAVFWKSGGFSLAAVGTCADGSRWLAPTNWVGTTTVERHWRRISHVEKIATLNDYAKWFALVMCSAAELEDAAHCLRDPEAKQAAISATAHYRAAAKTLTPNGGELCFTPEP